MYTTTVEHLARIDRRGGLVVEPNQTAAAQAVASPAPGIWPPPAPAGFEEFFCGSFRELVKAAMYAGATLQEAEDAAAKTLMEMLRRWDRCERSLAYARTAVIHNFIKAKTRGTARVARRLAERGHVPRQEGAEDSGLTAWEDEEWVAHVLSVLPPAQREVMELIVKELDRDEIAEALGKTKEAIRRNLCDARARLSRELNPDGSRRQDPDGGRRQQPPGRTARTPREEAR
jgi:RNA polymerase sigma factor (sigma-70 family)